MKILVTKQFFKFGQENIIPYAGKVKISEIGTIEVEDDVAQDIVNSDCGFEFFDGQVEETTPTATVEKTTTTTTVEETATTTTSLPETTTTTTIKVIGSPEEQDLGKTQEENLGGSQEEDQLNKGAEATTTTTMVEADGQIKIEAVKAELDKSTLAELKEMAKNFPSTEWRTLNKAELINYLASKI